MSKVSKLPLKRLSTFDTVIKTLGGTAKVASLLGISASYVCNWRRVSGKIPSKYFLEIRRLLADQGFEPDTRVFNFVRPRRRKAAFVASQVVFHDFRRRKQRAAMMA
jgi:hypothetical protein